MQEAIDFEVRAQRAMQLRPYQEEAVRAVLAALRDNPSTLLVLPTGCGKTITFAEITRRVVVNNARVLILAHRGELLTQAADKIRQYAGNKIRCQVEQAGERASLKADVVCASVQSMVGRLSRWPPDHFKIVIVDEAHHATATTYRKILAHFSGARMLGVTATPDRGDGVGLRNVFATVAYEYGIQEAIKSGYLSPIRQKTIMVEGLDLRAVRRNRGDLSLADLEAQLMQDASLHGVVGPLLAERGERPTMLFAATVAHARALAELINQYVGGSMLTAEAIDGSATQAERDRVVGSFSRGELPILVSCSLFTEGFDAPLTSCVAVARPTQSRALYAQVVGRGTRPSPDTGKADLLVLDFVGNAGKHRLVNALDVLAGDDLPDAVRKRAQELADEGADAMDALDDATREAKEAEERAVVIAEAKYKAKNVDPFAVLGVTKRKGFGHAPPTDGQLQMLSKAMGRDLPKDIDRRGASSLIEAIIKRRTAGQCSYKQARILAKHGLRDTVSFDDAKAAIDAIEANGWRCPPALLTDPRYA